MDAVCLLWLTEQTAPLCELHKKILSLSGRKQLHTRTQGFFCTWTLSWISTPIYPPLASAGHNQFNHMYWSLPALHSAGCLWSAPPSIPTHLLPSIPTSWVYNPFLFSSVQFLKYIYGMIWFCISWYFSFSPGNIILIFPWVNPPSPTCCSISWDGTDPTLLTPEMGTGFRLGQPEHLIS